METLSKCFWEGSTSPGFKAASEAELMETSQYLHLRVYLQYLCFKASSEAELMETFNPFALWMD